MNNRESLSHLVEIQYLLRERDALTAKIKAENERISALDERQEKAVEKIRALEEENRSMALKEKELTLSSLENAIEKLRAQLNLASNEKEAKGLGDTLKNKENEKQNLEEIVFQLLEKEEVNCNEIADLKNFLHGLQDTKKEIAKDASQNTQEESIKLTSNNNRLESLLNELSKDAYLVFERAQKKHPKTPLSYIAGLSCKECHMQLNSVLKTQVENMSSIEACPYCERILLPTNLNY